MTDQNWLPGYDGPADAPAPAPITDAQWAGLAGALSFPNGERPVIVTLETPGDGEVAICAAAEGCEIHYYDEGDIESYQFCAPLGTALMGSVLVAAATSAVIAHGPAEAARRLGWEQVC